MTRTVNESKREKGASRPGVAPTPTPGLLHRIGSLAATVGRSGPRRRSTRILLQSGLTAVILGLLVYTVASQWSEIRRQGIEFDLVWLLPAVPLIVLFYLGSALVWGMILRLLGSPVPAAETQRIWAQPLLVRYVPGTVLFLFARILMAERAGVPRRVSSAGLVYEQATTISGALTVAAWFLIGHPDLQGTPLRWLPLLVLPAMAVVLHPRVFGPLTRRVLTALGRDPLPRLMPFRAVMTIYIGYVVIWAVMGAGVFCAARSVHALPLGDLAAVAGAQAIGFLAAVASAVTPAGLGVRDAAFAWAVKVILPSGSFGVAVALALAVRAIQTLAELIYIGAVTLLTRSSGRSPSRVIPVVDEAPGS